MEPRRRRDPDSWFPSPREPIVKEELLLSKMNPNLSSQEGKAKPNPGKLMAGLCNS